MRGQLVVEALASMVKTLESVVDDLDDEEVAADEASWSDIRKFRAVAANWSDGPTCCGGGPAELAVLGKSCAFESALFAELPVLFELEGIDARSACSSCSAVELLETLDICTSLPLTGCR